MLNPWCVAVLLLAALPAPPSVRFKFMLDLPPALASEQPRLVDALRQGLFVDSVIVEAPAPSPTGSPARPDSARGAGMGRILIVRGSLRETAGLLEVQLRVYNILTQAMTGPATLRVAPAALDSALVAQGRHFARELAQRRR